MEIATGEVESFDVTARCGFITTEDASEDVFFRIKEGNSPFVEEGDEVRFRIVQTIDGLRAENVEPV
jgi:cold shock CspA family protein